MTKDERYIKALFKVLNEATLSLRGSEIPAYIEMVKWIKDLDARLNPPAPVAIQTTEEPKPVKKKTKKKTTKVKKEE